MNITPSLFEALLKCSTKCWLRFTCEPPTGNPYAEWVQAENESYRVATAERLMANLPADECAAFGSSRREEAHYSSETLKTAKWQLALDIPARTDLGSSRGNEAQTSPPENSQSLLTSAATIETCLHAVERIPSAGRGQPAQFVPIRFIYRNKLTKDDKLLLAFDAFVLSEMLGRAVSLGKIIHGDLREFACSSRGNGAQIPFSQPSTLNPQPISQSLLTSAATHNGVEEPQTGITATPGQPLSRATKIKTSALAGEVRKRLGKITALLASPTPPDLVLNRHCAECEFQARCRKIAIEKDDLSLLAGMSAKERQKLRSKGIFTVTQLSYTFRPRRRPKRRRDKREKYHHALKALAIREQKIHIVGSPELELVGTPVCLDVEGLPDRDFYYLIGLCIGNGDSAVQHSLWADTVADEGKIWREFLALLETVEQPVLIHYGSYEKNFLKEMKDRHGEPTEESTVAKSMQASVNLLLHNFAQIYFPGISNGLKDTAGSLGFKWGETGASGLNAIAWRCQWEEFRQAMFEERLIAYNTQDCEALAMVTDRILQLTSQRTADESSQTGNANVVRVDSKEFQWKSKWKEFKSPVSGFEFINAAAHWDYQRHRVYARSGKAPKKPSAPRRVARNYGLTQLAIRLRASWWCPKCKIRGQFIDTASKTVHDIVFGRQSLKLRAVKYVFRTYRCRKCHGRLGLAERFSIFRRYGWNLVAYLIYQIIDLNIPQHTVVCGFNTVFHFDLHKNTLNHMKVRVGNYYAETRQQILAHIVQGSLVHADETRANIKGKIGFVWVLTNMNEVYYTLADSREGDMVQKLLPDYKGVLVSDFYTAYLNHSLQ
ncbi:MAG: TM0106 family RecB-like putative nuclease [Verrucomicrobiales bacterium]|nr:TM0106 family RecB-like putative nuclease [Verrucomicrobiales bacterium]